MGQGGEDAERPKRPLWLRVLVITGLVIALSVPVAIAIVWYAVRYHGVAVREAAQVVVDQNRPRTPEKRYAPTDDRPTVPLFQTVDEMRRALSDRYRLKADRRFLLALDTLALLQTGRAPELATAAFDGHEWVVSRGANRLGTLPEMPDFADAGALLDRVAQSNPAAPAGGVTVALTDALTPDAALARLHDVESQWASGPTAAVAARTVEAFASLVARFSDRLGVGDEVASSALATLVVAKRLGVDVRAAEALIASVMGYTATARKTALTLDAKDPIRQYVFDDEASLERAKTTFGKLLLQSIRLPRSGSTREGAEAGVAGALTLDGIERRLATEDFDFQKRMRNALPMVLLAYIEADAGSERAKAAVASLAASDESEEVLSAVSAKLETDLGATDSDVLPQADASLSQIRSGAPRFGGARAAYLDASFQSALELRATFLLYKLAALSQARGYRDALVKVTSRHFQPFLTSFDLRIQAVTGSIRGGEFLGGMKSVAELGGTAAYRLYESLDGFAEWSAPERPLAVRLLATQSDTRPDFRLNLAYATYQSLNDPIAAQALYASLFDTSPGRYPSQEEWWAERSFDTERLKSFLDAPSLLTVRDRFRIVQVLEKSGVLTPADAEARVRAMVRYDAEFGSVSPYVDWLQKRDRFEDAAAAARRWLAAHPGARSIDRVFAVTAVAREQHLMKHDQEAWDTVSPVLVSYQGGAMQLGAKVLAALGRNDEARRLAARLWERYPESPSSIVTAAQIEWALGSPEGAASVIGRGGTRLRFTEWHDDVAPAFLDAFAGRSTADVQQAVRGLQSAGVPAYYLPELASVAHDRGQHQLAFDIYDAIAATGSAIPHLAAEAYGELEEARGEDTAVKWLDTRLPRDANLRASFASISFAEHHATPLWTVVPTPAAPGMQAELVWLFRGAAHVRFPDSDPTRAAQLEAHFAAPTGATRYHVIGRYLLGKEPFDAIFRLASDEESKCEIAYYAGVKAEGDKQYRDAATLYRVASEIDRGDVAERVFAWDELRRWTRTTHPLPGLGIRATDPPSHAGTP